MPNKVKIIVCTKGKTCKKRGAKKVLNALEDAVDEYGLEDKICLKKSECLGKCGRGPVAKVKDSGDFFGFLEPDNCIDLVKYLKKKQKASLKKEKIKS